MRGPLPLSDSDFAAVRASVLARIETRHRAPWGELAALAASVAIAVLSVVVARRPIVVPASAPHVIPSVARDLGAREAPRPRHTPTPVPPLRVAQGRHDKPHRHHHPPAAHVARIELHTTDPNVRIIWFTN